MVSHQPSSDSLTAWRQGGFTENDLPQNIEDLLRQKLAVPDEFQYLIPNPKLSVLDFAAQSFIRIDDTLSANIPQSLDLFSANLPCVDIPTLVEIIAPGKGLLARLMGQVIQKFLDGMNSIILPYVPDVYIPLWMIKYWSTLVVHTLPVQLKWQHGIAWLQDPERSAFSHYTSSLFHSLGSLPWSGSISTEGAFGLVRHSKEILPVYLSRQWLRDDHIDHMICSLNTRLLPNSSVVLLDTINARILQRAYSVGGSNQRDVDTLIRFRPRLL